MAVHLIPESASADAIYWRVGPGLVRHSDTVGAADAPAPLRSLFDAGVLAGVAVEPGRIVTYLGSERTAAADGPAIRTALFKVLSADGGWPAPDAGVSVAQAADAEIAAAVGAVLAGEFGTYTATHGGRVELLGVEDGQVRVALAGQCHGCAAADATVKQNLAARLATIPGFRGVVVAGEESCPASESRRLLLPLLRFGSS